MKKCTGDCGEMKSFSQFRKYRNKCKACEVNSLTVRQRTLKGKLMQIFNNQIKAQKHRSKMSGKEYLVEYSRVEFIEWGLQHKIYIKLHEKWHESGYDKKLSPSFDRVDDYGNYSFENFNKWMTFDENHKKYHSDSVSGVNVKQCRAVNGICIKTGDVVSYFSMHKASRDLNIGMTSISNCYLGRSNSAGGYIWSYSDLNGDKQHDRKMVL